MRITQVVLFVVISVIGPTPGAACGKHAGVESARVAATPSAEPEGNATRDPWLWPFASNSEWNTPLASGAQFAAADDPMSRDVTSGSADIHAGTWSHPVFLAKNDDPERAVYDTENKRPFSARIPVGAKPDPMHDAHMYVVQPDKHQVVEMYGAKVQPNGDVIAVRAFVVDLYGSGMHIHDGSLFPGVRAMDASGFGGLIRVWELKAHRIRHVLTFLLPYARLKHGPVWPSSREDYWGRRDYKGNVPIGTLIAIPPDVNIHALGLTPSGLALATALQDYGAYCDDSAGSSGILLSAEGAAEGMPELVDMRKDFAVIHNYLRPVINNRAETRGGGGTPRQPPPPPLE